jgi:hypothetical protein
MYACPHVKLSAHRNTVESLVLSSSISPRLTSLTPYLLPYLTSATSLIHLRLTRPCLPLSLPLLPPNTPAHSEPNFGKVVGWFENLVASIRIKIRIYKNYPVFGVEMFANISGENISGGTTGKCKARPPLIISWSAYCLWLLHD